MKRSVAMLLGGLALAWLGLQVLEILAIVVLASCSETMAMELPSPDARSVAMVFERNCGATTSLLTEVTLRTRPQILDLGVDGSIFRYDGRTLGLENVYWADARGLVIEHGCIPARNVATAQSTWHDVSVTYVDRCPGGTPSGGLPSNERPSRPASAEIDSALQSGGPGNRLAKAHESPPAE